MNKISIIIVHKFHLILTNRNVLRLFNICLIARMFSKHTHTHTIYQQVATNQQTSQNCFLNNLSHLISTLHIYDMMLRVRASTKRDKNAPQIAFIQKSAVFRSLPNPFLSGTSSRLTCLVKDYTGALTTNIYRCTT